MDEAKTAVVIRYGAFEFKVMPFILKKCSSKVLHGDESGSLARISFRVQLLEYRARSSNHVADALIWHDDLAVIFSMAALLGSDVTTTTRDRIRALLEKDPATYLVDLIKQGKTRNF
ncbi:RNA-directed DNA polymerase [Abeliophyllum distichum]|uniref:RNA-directed DNA polymerase n=1 Tax=Abeliophyllum distichum TaxID=126358 RepID=A0ABD1TZM1_9LAMI